MKSKMMKKMGISALALSLSFGLTSPAVLAHHDFVKAKHETMWNHNYVKYENKWKHKFFKDEDDAKWAIKSIIKMKGKGVFNGYKDGTFLPNKPISRVEAVVAAVRLLGLESEAKARGDMDLNFRDAKEIDKRYGWAEGYIAVALENGLFDSNMSSFKPGEPASREWVATLLVRALDLEDEALKRMNEHLPFKDSREISAGAVGYVAVAVEQGLIIGNEKGMFQPHKPITRAEMATVLDRFDWLNDDDDFVSGVEGTVNRVWPEQNKIEVKKANGEFVTVSIEDNTYIFLDGKMVAKTEIAPGYKIMVIYNNERKALLVDMKSAGNSTIQWLSGSIEEVTLPTATANGKIEIDLNGGEDKYYTLTTNTKVKTDGLELHLSDLKEDQEVRFKVEGNVITEIYINGTIKTFTGVLKEIKAPTDSNNGQLEIVTANGNLVIMMAKEVLVRYGNETIQLSNLKVGDTVEINTFEGLVKKVTVKELATVNYKGTVESIQFPSGTSNGSIEIDLGNQDLTFTLTNDTKVRSNGLGLHLSDLAINQKVEMFVNNSVVTEIVIDGIVASQYGEVVAISAPANNNPGTITLKRNDGTFTLNLASQLTITKEGKDLLLSDVKVGNWVELTTFNGNVKNIKVTDDHNTIHDGK
jgi:hypothetical protein